MVSELKSMVKKINPCRPLIKSARAFQQLKLPLDHENHSLADALKENSFGFMTCLYDE
jgi:hypothetical protein